MRNQRLPIGEDDPALRAVVGGYIAGDATPVEVPARHEGPGLVVTPGEPVATTEPRDVPKAS